MRPYMKSNFMQLALSLFAAASLLFAGAAHGASNTLVHVVNAGIYGNGDVFINVDAVLQEAGCAGQRVEIAAANPAAKSFLAIALLAYTQGSVVRIITTGCTGNHLVSGAMVNYPFIDVSLDGRVALQ